MQLELFDIQTADPGRKGKAGRSAANDGRSAAGQKSGAREDKGADFLASLRTVSREDQLAAEDQLNAEAGLKLNPADTQPIRLSEVLNEIIREWPAGRRPAGAIAAGDDIAKNSASDRLAARGRHNTPAALAETGRTRMGLGRAKQGLDGFTAALVKRLGRATGQKASRPGDGPAMKATPAAGKAAGGEPVRQLASTHEQGSRQGVRILNLNKVNPGPIDSSADLTAAAADAGKTGRSVSKRAAQTAPVGLKGTLPQPGSSTAGGNEIPDIKETITVAREHRMTQPTGEPSRPAAVESSFQAVGKPLGGNKLHAAHARTEADDRLPSEKPKASTKVAKPAAEISAAAIRAATPKTIGTKSGQPQTADKPAVAAVSSGDKSVAAGLETENQPTRLRAAPVKADTFIVKSGQEGKAAVQIDVAARQAEARAGLGAAKHDFKTEAVSGRKTAVRVDLNLVDRENPHGDSIGPATSRETRGADQPRFEFSDAKIKLAEAAPAAPKAQPAVQTTAPAPETDKAVLDRVAEARVLEQIAAKVRLHPKNGANEIRLQLRPETLGQMQLKILAQDQTISVKMVAETVMAREIIENNISQLRADLNALGLNVDKLDVEVSSTQDPGEKDTPGQRGGFTKHGRGSAQQSEHENEPGDEQARQPLTAEDETEEGSLVGVFA